MRLGVIQPYFFPYAGYFRLLSLCDHLVFFDCVQFPRRGYVHRNQVQDNQGNRHWFTLPLLKQAQSTVIRDLKFHHQATQMWQEQLLKLERLIPIKRDLQTYQQLADLPTSPLKKLIDSCAMVIRRLKIKCHWSFSSELKINEKTKGQQRIIEICRRLGCTEYINPPGGKSLYEPDEFKKYDIRLGFLTDYHGRYDSILTRLVDPTDRTLIDEFYHPDNQNIEWASSRIKNK